MSKNLINLDDYDESMLNDCNLEGIVGSIYDHKKYLIFYITYVAVHGYSKTRHTFRCNLWKSKFTTVPRLKRGDHIVIHGSIRQARLYKDSEETVPEFVVEAISLK